MKISDIVSMLIAAGVFFGLLFGLGWNGIVAAGLAVGVYFAFSLILKPRRRIGGVDVENIRGGEQIEAKLDNARGDLKDISRAGQMLRSYADKNDTRADAFSRNVLSGIRGIADGSGKLAETGGSIIQYLEKHADQIPQAHRFLDYYLDAAVEILGKYSELLAGNMPDAELARVTGQTESAVRTLNEAFSTQYSRLLQGEVMDMEVNIDVLKNMADSDNGNTPFGKTADSAAERTAGGKVL